MSELDQLILKNIDSRDYNEVSEIYKKIREQRDIYDGTVSIQADTLERLFLTRFNKPNERLCSCRNSKNSDEDIKNIIKNIGFGKIVDLYLDVKVREVCEKQKGKIEAPVEECRIIVTDTFVEVLEKFIISHVRNWNNESDARRENATIEELGQNRLREVENNGRIRPRLVEALSEMFQATLDGKLQIAQKSVKMYDVQAKSL